MTSGGDEARDGRTKGSSLPTARDAAAGERKPTPVRTLVSVRAAAGTAEPAVEEVTFAAQGQEWIVRVMGRGGSSAPLLLLGFWPKDAADGDPACESYRPGSTLLGMDEDALAETLAVARPRSVERRPGEERSSRARTRRSGSRPTRPERGGDARRK